MFRRARCVRACETLPNNPATIVSPRSTVLFGVAGCVALLMAVQRISPFLFLDAIVRSIELIAATPVLLFLVIPLLILTAGAGAWVTVLGVKGLKPKRGHRRKVRVY